VYLAYRDLVRTELGVEPSGRFSGLIASAVDLDLVDGWASRAGLTLQRA
jgi:hypothetical protein